MNHCTKKKKFGSYGERVTFPSFANVNLGTLYFYQDNLGLFFDQLKAFLIEKCLLFSAQKEEGED